MSASLGDLLNDKSKNKLLDISITPGSVFLNKFDDIDHPKFFIVAGICIEHIFVCSVFINSNIHPSIQKKPSVLNLQIPIKKTNNLFLDYDSFVCCSSPLQMKADKIRSWINNKSCKIIGNINGSDLEIIIESLKKSGLLTPEEISTYFDN